MRVESPTKKYIAKSYDKKAQYDKMCDDMDSVYPFFYEKMTKGTRNHDYTYGKQWTDAEKYKHEQQLRYPYVFNIIRRIVNHLCGTETKTRMDAIALPREHTDESSVQLLNFILKWLEQVNQLSITQSAVFRSAVVKGAGAASVRWVIDDLLYGYPQVEYVPIEELYWDTNSVKIDLSDARFLGRNQLVTKLDAYELFPEHADLIEKTSMNFWHNIQRHNYWKKYLKNIRTTSLTDDYRSIIPLAEYYEYMKVYTTYVIDSIQDNVHIFDIKDEGQAFYNGLIDQYTSDGIDVYGADGNPLMLCQTIDRDVINQTVAIGEEVIHTELTALSNYPYHVLFSNFADGDYAAVIDDFIDPQYMVNRSMSMYDHQLGSAMKNVLGIMPGLLAKGFTPEDLRRELSKANALIFINHENAIKQYPQQQANPQLFQNIPFLIGFMNDLAGGKNQLGLQENANESGKAVLARAELGGMGKLPLFDALKLWRTNVTYQLAWYAKNFLAPGQVLRIIGDYQDLQYVELDEGILDNIAELRYDITIDETEISKTMDEYNLNIIKEMVTQVQFPAEIIMPLMVKYLNLPQSEKTNILSQMDFYKKYQMAKSQQAKQEKMQTEVQDSIYKTRLKEAIKQKDDIARIEKETEQSTKRIKTKLDDVEKIKMRMRAENTTPQENMKMVNSLQTPEEIRGYVGASQRAIKQ